MKTIRVLVVPVCRECGNTGKNCIGWPCCACPPPDPYIRNVLPLRRKYVAIGDAHYAEGDLFARDLLERMAGEARCRALNDFLSPGGLPTQDCNTSAPTCEPQ